MIDEAQHKMAVDAIGFAFQLLSPQEEYLRSLVEAETSMHSYMHITDPTFYIRAMNDRGLRHQIDLAKAALAFVAAVQKVKGEIEEATP